MGRFIRNNRGATAVEFALVALPVLTLILGIMQTAWIVWIANLLHVSADAAARCGAVQSTTSPCNGSVVPAVNAANMLQTANLVFGLNPKVTKVTFSANSSCSNDGGSGVVGTYQVTIAFVVKLTLTASSCYPNVPLPS